MRVSCLCALSVVALAVTACESTPSAIMAEPVEAGAADAALVKDTIAARSEEDKARDQWRHPAETLAFFGLTPDMTVVDALPGRGWYTRIILPVVAENGRYIGVNYQDGMWPLILPNPTPDLVDRLSNWTDSFPETTLDIAAPTTPVTAYEFGALPGDLDGAVDLVLMIRALHNFNRAGGDFGAEALTDAYRILKPGGVLGVVQHASPAGAEGPAADGSMGYMSKAAVVEMAAAAGFVLEAESDINANPADQPGAGEIVWRLPPTYGLGDQDREKYAAIGESNRMTLRFRKPAN